MADNSTLSGGTSKGSFDPIGILDKALDFGTQIGVAAYNSHNAKKAAERQIEATKELMALQYQYNKWAYQYQQTKGPSLYRQGLTDAGYNPILPFTGGSGLTNASFGATGQGSAALENPALVDGNSINNARLVSLQQNQIKSQIQNTNANTELQQEQAQSERVDQVLKSNQAEIARLDTQLKQKDLDVWDKRWALEQKERLTSINTMLRNARSQEAIAGSSVTSAKAAATQADVTKELKNFEIEWIKKHPYLYSVNKAIGGTGVSSLIKPR